MMTAELEELSKELVYRAKLDAIESAERSIELAQARLLKRNSDKKMTPAVSNHWNGMEEALTLLRACKPYAP